MTTAVYRYKFTGVGQPALQRRVPGTPTFSAIGYVTYADITVDDANKADLDADMLLERWSYYSTNPTKTPATEALDALLFSPFTEKTVPVIADITWVEQASDSTKKKVLLDDLYGSGSEFGVSRQFASNLVSASVTGTTWTQYLRLTTGASTEAGWYRVEVAFGWAFSNVGYSFEARAQVDDTISLNSGRNWANRPKTGDTIVRYPEKTVSLVQLTAGAHTIDLDYHAMTAGYTAYMIYAYIQLWKVADSEIDVVMTLPGDDFARDKTSDVNFVASGTHTNAATVEIWAKIGSAAFTSWGLATIDGSNWSFSRAIQNGDLDYSVKIVAVATCVCGTQKAVEVDGSIGDVSALVTTYGGWYHDPNNASEITLDGAVTIPNAGFATDTGWTKGTGWTISGGTGNHASGSLSTINQNLATIGKRYLVGVTLVSNSGGTGIAPRIGDNSGAYSAVLGEQTFEAYCAASQIFGVNGAAASTSVIDDFWAICTNINTITPGIRSSAFSTLVFAQATDLSKPWRNNTLINGKYTVIGDGTADGMLGNLAVSAYNTFHSNSGGYFAAAIATAAETGTVSDVLVGTYTSGNYGPGFSVYYQSNTAVAGLAVGIGGASWQINITTALARSTTAVVEAFWNSTVGGSLRINNGTAATDATFTGAVSDCTGLGFLRHASAAGYSSAAIGANIMLASVPPDEVKSYLRRLMMTWAGVTW